MIRNGMLSLATALLSMLACSSNVMGQLQITEVLFDSNTSPEGNWEWFELYNAGNSDVDLDGYFFDDRSTAVGRTVENISSIVGESSVNTVVPAQTAAVVYNGEGLDFDEARFRNAWNIASSVPLIGVNGWQALNQGGDAFGLWDSFESYESDLANTDADDDLEVATFDSAVVSIDYGAEGFPGAPAGSSLQWNGSGDFQLGENWTASEEGTSVLSVATFLADTQINDTADVGNPGLVVGSTDGFNGVAITEILYNPASAEPDWEWIEIFNGTGSEIDFGATPYVLDDRAGGELSGHNINSGSVADGETAILFSVEDVSIEDMTIAWGNQNFIPVVEWPALNNSGDLVGLWDDIDEYSLDSEGGGDRTAIGAVASVEYLDGDEDWPNVGQGNSISILELDEDTGLGTNWTLSTDGDGDSVFAAPVISSLPDHAGGDLGTPGVFGSIDPPTGLDLNGDGSINAADGPLVCANAGDDVAAFLTSNGSVQGDFDLDGTVAFADFLTLSTSFGQDGNYGQGDANCTGSVEFADFLILSQNFGQTAGAAASAVPEPSSHGLFLFAIGAFACFLRKRR